LGNKVSKDELLTHIIIGIEDVKGHQITLLDLRNLENTVCDYFVICSGNSSTQVEAIKSSINKTISKKLKEKPWHIEDSQNSEWVLIDYVDIVVHIFQKHIREYYNLEDMWGDAKIERITTDFNQLEDDRK
jgi:ribosome-associated protein